MIFPCSNNSLLKIFMDTLTHLAWLGVTTKQDLPSFFSLDKWIYSRGTIRGFRGACSLEMTPRPLKARGQESDREVLLQKEEDQSPHSTRQIEGNSDAMLGQRCHNCTDNAAAPCCIHQVGSSQGVKQGLPGALPEMFQQEPGSWPSVSHLTSAAISTQCEATAGLKI